MGSKLFNKLKSLLVVTSCSTGIFSALSIYNGNEKFYDGLLMPLVYYLPPELSHKLALIACKHELFRAQKNDDPELLKTTFLGRRLTNPIGVPAGFDKNGEAIYGLGRIGFGLIEIGSVTPIPQDGNPKPRMFRLTADKAVINRCGFNNDGHDKVFERINKMKMSGKTVPMLGINLGKNKTTVDNNKDYIEGIIKFAPVADYFVINISSPNTPGLRSLQNRENLSSLLKAARTTRDGLPNDHNRIPLLVKIAPDLSPDELLDVVKVIQTKDCKVDGIIISNTTIARHPDLKSNTKSETGGLSGAPLFDRSTEMIRDVYRLTNGNVPIVGVGGIFSGKDAYEKILAGASVVQLYTAFVYHGPPIIEKVKRELNELLHDNGFKSVDEAIGAGVNK